jgi:hypothetical protein
MSENLDYYYRTPPMPAGTGYATLRMANNNGQNANGNFDTNTYIDRVVSRGGGRGVFCVSRSGGVVIQSVDLVNNGNNAILIENCQNVAIRSGIVSSGGEVRLAARSEFPNNRDISVTITVSTWDARSIWFIALTILNRSTTRLFVRTRAAKT